MRSGKTRWALLGVLAPLVGGGGYLGYDSSRYVPVAHPTVKVGDTELSGTAAEVRKGLEAWADEVLGSPRKMGNKILKGERGEVTAGGLGLAVDLEKTLAHVEYTNYWMNLTGAYSEDTPARETEAAFDDSGLDTGAIEAFVKEHAPELGSAKATWDGSVRRQYEVTPFELDSTAAGGRLIAAVKDGSDFEIPLKEGAKDVPDSELEKITEVHSEFSTSFSTGKVSRCLNIKRAAELIDGTVLMPGEAFSFNGHLGRRTVANGFHVAGVYVSGRHDVDVGGGICQVSTTIYNALLLGELKVNQRSPHSLPVPYVPLGRDAAVSYPNPDLKFTNDTDGPVAISMTYTPGKLYVRILGEGQHGREVKFESKLISSWSRGEKIVDDPSLPPGKTKVMDAGGSGRKVRTWKVVYQDGKEIERTNMGDSVYSGGPRIIAANRRPAAPKPVVPAGGTPPVGGPAGATGNLPAGSG